MISCVFVLGSCRVVAGLVLLLGGGVRVTVGAVDWAAGSWFQVRRAI